MTGAGGIFADLNLIIAANDLCIPPGSENEDPPQTLLTQADAGGISIHCLCLPGASDSTRRILTEISRQTGGVLFSAKSEEEIPQVLEITYMSLCNGYDILCPAPVNPGPGLDTIQLRVKTDLGFGEGEATLFMENSPAHVTS